MIFRLLTGEMLKFRKRLATLIMVVALLLLVLLDYWQYSMLLRDSAVVVRRGLPDLAATMLDRNTSPSVFVACIMTVLMMAGEFEWRIARQQLIDGLGRTRWFVVKSAWVISLALGFQVFKLVIAWILINWVFKFTIPAGTFFDAQHLQQLTGTLTGALLACLIGFWVTLVVRTAGASLIATLAVILVDSAANAALVHYEFVSVAQHLPIQVMQGLLAGRTYYPIAAPPGVNLPVSLTFSELAFTALAWMLALLVSGWFMFKKRDV